MYLENNIHYIIMMMMTMAMMMHYFGFDFVPDLVLKLK